MVDPHSTGQGGATVHPNEQAVRAGYDAFITGDLEAVSRLLDPDVLWHVAGSSALAGVYKGHAEVFSFFARLIELTKGTLTIAARDILASDDHVIVLTTTQAQVADRTLDDRGVVIFNVTDGLATEVWMFADDQAGMDAFIARVTDAG